MEVPGPPTPLCRSVTAPPYTPCCEERVEWESTGWVRVTRVGRCLFSYGCCFVVGRSHSGQRRWGHVACALYCGPHPLSMHTASKWHPPSTHEAHVTAYHGIPRQLLHLLVFPSVHWCECVAEPVGVPSGPAAVARGGCGRAGPSPGPLSVSHGGLGGPGPEVDGRLCQLSRGLLVVSAGKRQPSLTCAPLVSSGGL